MNIKGETKQQQVNDRELASTDPDQDWERYALVNTKHLEIFARNKFDTPEQETFMINLKMTKLFEEVSPMQQLTVMLMMILLCCLCMACCAVFVRIGCKSCKRRAVNNRNSDVNRGD